MKANKNIESFYLSSNNKPTAQLFDYMSQRYEALYSCFSLGIDRFWRRAVSLEIKINKPQTIIDFNTGTAQQAIDLCKTIDNCNVIGIDISENMLEKGRRNISKYNFESRIDLKIEDCENLSFENNSFDAVSMSFGARLLTDWKLGIIEMYRVVKPGGTIVILEFSRVPSVLVKHGYNFYYKTILPSIKRLQGDKDKRYNVFADSILNFPKASDFKKYLGSLGFKNIRRERLTLGICNIYIAIK